MARRILIKIMLQRGYIILIIGAALLIAGILISVIWADSFARSFLRQGVILSDVAVPPSGTATNTIQVIDISHPIALQIRFQAPSNSGQATNSNNTTVNLRELVKDPNGSVLSQNYFSKQLFTTFKPTIPGKYTLTISNVGSAPVRIGALFGSASFVNKNNQINVNLFSELIAGIILVIVGIITVITGIVIVILDRRKGRGKKPIATR
jgi:uncharacterized membrane protein